MLSDEASKLHKSLDLTIYFDYLRQLFAQTTSDSDTSDSDDDVIKHEELDTPSLSNPTPTSTPPNFPNDTSPSSSSKSNYNFTPSSGNSNGDEESSPSARTTKSSSSSGNSLTSSGNSTDEEDDCSDLDLTPISDLELNNIFLDHKLWKKSPEPGQDFLIIPPDIKKERRDVFSDGGGPTSKSQSLLSKDRHGRHSLQNMKLKYSVTPSTSRASLISELKLDLHPKIGGGLEHVGGVLEDGGVGIAQVGSSHILMREAECGDDEDCQDDNDSLSDYMNMTANSALVLDPYFKYESDCVTPNSVTPIPNVLGKIHIHDIRRQHKHMVKSGSSHHHHSSKHKKISEQKRAKTIESMNLKRRRLYILLCKKEIGKTQRARVNNHKEMLITQRRLALACNRHFRKKAIQSQKAMKESIWRAKRHSREMQAYWKQADRVEREVRKRREKESDEQRRIDKDMMEAKIQQRKLNFLITQIELFAHFVTKTLKDSNSVIREESEILNQLSEESNKGSEDYGPEEMKNKAIENVENAYKIQLGLLQPFNLECKIKSDVDGKEMSQPHGDLTQCQLKTLNWLTSRFDHGINCILTDETELGKTVQSIRFLARVAESYGVWGPFLIIAPTSTLHNWQQDFSRIRPDFKVAPYWGNPQERNILREVWQLSDSQKDNTIFHVVVTSYQIVVADFKYFKQINWQSLILDEAETINSISSSEKWKLLSGFNTRNRLLITGTQIKNTMEELWTLLYFIMPSLFDSQNEFNECFRNYIESQVENKSIPDENHLSRLLTILKPFIWRRSENDIEHRPLDKIEVILHCPLTITQQLRYKALKKKVRVEDLLKISGSSNSPLVQQTTTNLTNLVTQFRKVCNHPSLFDRCHISSPYFMPLLINTFPKMLMRSHSNLHHKPDLMSTGLNIYDPARVNESLVFGEPTNTIDCLTVKSEWSFIRFIGLSISEFNQVVNGGPMTRWKYVLDEYRKLEVIYRQRQWNDTAFESRFTRRNDFLLDTNPTLSFVSQQDSMIIRDLVFVVPTGCVYTLLQQKISSIPETIEHRKLRCRKLPSSGDSKGPTLLEECVHRPREYFREVCPTQMPSFLSNLSPAKVRCGIAQTRAFKNEIPFSEEVLAHRPVTVSLFNEIGNLSPFYPQNGWSQLIIPDKEKLVTASGKLRILDNVLKKLKSERHRVIIYSQMTRMIDILEEYISYRQWTYLRLDGPSRILDKKYNVSELQSSSDIFIYLVLTRAGGSITCTPDADTVIFYDSDWNPLVEQQALDRAFYRSQTKQVTLYRLISNGTVEERVLQRAKQKAGKLVISGKNFRPDALKPSEIVSLLMDDDELERKFLQKQAEGKAAQIERSNPSTSGVKRKSLPFVEKVPISKDVDSALKRSKVQDGSATSGELGLMSIIGSESSATESPIQQEMYFDGEIGSEMTDELYSSNDDDFIEGSDLDEFCGDDYDTVDGGPCSKSQSNTESVSSDIEDDYGGLISSRKLGRGSGKRGRPPLRVRTVTREIDGDSPFRRGPGRPRIKPIGPANQGVRGRGPGRPRRVF